MTPDESHDEVLSSLRAQRDFMVSMSSPTAAYPEPGSHPLQERINSAFRWLTDSRSALDDDHAQLIATGLAAIRWIDMDAAPGIPVNIEIDHNPIAHLEQLVHEWLVQLEHLVHSRSAPMFQRTLKSSVGLLVQLAPLYGLHRWEAARVGISQSIDVNTAQQKLDEIEQMHADVRDKTEALIGLVDLNFEAAVASHYDHLAATDEEAAAKARSWVIGLAVGGPLVLGAVAVAWGVVIAKTSVDFSLESTLVGLAVKLPLAIAWLWGLRLASRDYAAAQHRAAVAHAKRAALLTYDMLRDRASTTSGQDALLAAIAPLVLEPNNTGLIRDHGDGLSIGPQHLTLGSVSRE